MAMLALKIIMADSSVDASLWPTKTMRFASHLSVSECIVQIRTDTEVGGKDRGLYIPPGDGVPGRWLESAKTLQEMGITTGDELVFQKKHRPQKVQLLDRSVITVFIDSSRPIREVMKDIGEKIGIDQWEEYSLRHDGRWLIPGQPLLEQGLGDRDVVIFRRKYFITDANVDKSDPKQLNLLYHQCVVSVIEGELVCNLDEAISFAAMQLQVEHGNYDPNKHKPGSEHFIKEKFLAPAFHKEKKVEKMLYRDWEKLMDTNAIDAKYRYVKLCRSLATYGTSIFETYEPHPRKPKRKARMLLAFSRDHVMRIEPKTGQIVETIRLPALKRWNATDDSIMLDFGEARGEYYQAESPQGPDIARYIGGLVDIIMRRRKEDATSELIDGTDGQHLEDTSPEFGTVTESNSVQIMLGDAGAMFGEEGQLGDAAGSAGRFGGASLTVADLPSALQAARRLIDDFNLPFANGAMLGDPEQLKQSLLDAANTLGKAVSDLVNGLDEEDRDRNAQLVCQNLKALIDAARCASAANDNQALLEAGRRLAEAVRDILAAANTLSDNPGDLEAQKALQDAVAALKGASAFCKGAVHSLLSDDPSEQLLLESARRVTDSVRKLAGNVNTSANRLPDGAEKERLRAEARNAALAGNHVSEAAKVVAPLADPAAAQQLIDAGKRVYSEVDRLVGSANSSAIPEQEKKKILAAAKVVSDALAQLVDATGAMTSRADAERLAVTVALVDIQSAAYRLMDSAGDKAGLEIGAGMMRNGQRDLMAAAQVAAQASTENALLLDSAEKVGMLVADTLAATQVSMENPRNMDNFKAMLHRAQITVDACKALLGHNTDFVPYDHARYLTKMVAATASNLVTVTKFNMAEVDDVATQKVLFVAAKDAEAAVASMVAAVRESAAAPRDQAVQHKCIGDIKDAVKVVKRLVDRAEEAQYKIPDTASKNEVVRSKRACQGALTKLQAALDKTATTEEQEYALIMRDFEAVASKLEAAALDAQVGSLQQSMPRVQAMKDLKASVGSLRDSAIAVKNSRTQGEANKAARGSQVAMSKLADASIHVAAATTGQHNQEATLKTTRTLVPDLMTMIEAAKANIDKNTPETEVSLKAAAKQVSMDLKDLMTSTQGETGGPECDAAVTAIQAERKKLGKGAQAVPADRLMLVTQELSNTAKAISAQANKVAATSRSAPTALGPLVEPLPTHVGKLVHAANTLAASTAAEDPTLAKSVLATTNAVGEYVARLVYSAKTAKMDPQADRDVTKAQKNLAAAIKKLMASIAMATPGQSDFDAALATLDKAKDMVQPLPSSSYTIQKLNAAGRDLSAALDAEVAAGPRNPGQLGSLAVPVADAVLTIVLNARGYGDLTRTLSPCASYPDMIAGLRAAKTPDDYVGGTRVLLGTVKPVFALMKQLSTTERDEAVRQRMATTSQAVKASLEALIAAGKAVNKRGAGPHIVAAAEVLVQHVNSLLQTAPGTRQAINLLLEGRGLTLAARKVVESAHTVATRPTDAMAQGALAQSGRDCHDALERLMAATIGLSVGRTDMEAACKSVEKSVAELESAAVSAQLGLLAVPTSKSHQLAQEGMVSAARSLDAAVASLAKAAADGDMATMGDRSREAAEQVTAAVTTCREMAGTTSDQAFQTKHVNLMKDCAEAILACMNEARDLTGDASNAQLVQRVKAKETVARERLHAMLSELRGGVLGLRACDEAVATILAAGKTLDQPGSATSYRHACDEVVGQAKGLAGNVQRLFTTAKTAPSGVGGPSKDIADNVVALVNAARDATAVLDDPSLRAAVVERGKATTTATANMVQLSKAVAEDPNPENLAALSQAFQAVTASLGGLVRAVKDADTGEKDCREAIAALGRVQAELDAAMIFAETGQLEVEGDPKLASSARAMEQHLSQQMASQGTAVAKTSTQSQQALGHAAQDLAASAADMVDHCRNVAHAIADPVTTKAVLSGAKSVAVRSQQLVQASKKRTEGGPGDDARVRDKQKALADDLAALQAVVSKAAGERLRCESAVEAARQAVAKAKAGYDSSAGTRGATAKQAAGSTQAVARATATFVAGAATSTDALIAAAQGYVTANASMLNDARGAAELAPDAATKAAIGDAVKTASGGIEEILRLAKEARQDDWDAQDLISAQSDRIADQLGAVVQALKKLPGQEDLDDEGSMGAEVVAALEDALAQVDAQATSFADAVAVSNVDGGLEEGDVAAIVVNAAKAIGSTTSNLIKASLATQHELVAKGKANPRFDVYRKDPAWAQGLIKTSGQVPVLNEAFVEAVNAVAEAEQSDLADTLEDLVHASTESGEITQRLVASAKAKADPNAPSSKKLTAAGKAVEAAIQALIDAARSAIKSIEDAKSMDSGTVSWQQRLQDPEMLMQLEIARLERELAASLAQQRLVKQKAQAASGGGGTFISNPLMRG